MARSSDVLLVDHLGPLEGRVHLGGQPQRLDPGDGGGADRLGGGGEGRVVEPVGRVGAVGADGPAQQGQPEHDVDDEQGDLHLAARAPPTGRGGVAGLVDGGGGLVQLVVDHPAMIAGAAYGGVTVVVGASPSGPAPAGAGSAARPPA